jgi:hypothetical protein
MRSQGLLRGCRWGIRRAGSGFRSYRCWRGRGRTPVPDRAAVAQPDEWENVAVGTLGVNIGERATVAWQCSQPWSDPLQSGEAASYATPSDHEINSQIGNGRARVWGW